MNLTLIDKLGLIFKYIFSSFLSIEMFIISLLLLSILILNLKKKNHIIDIISVGIYFGFVLGVLVTYSDYVKICIDSLFKEILNYIYFPSTIIYFFIIIFTSIMMVVTLFSRKMSNVKKIINYLFFSILYFFFVSFVALASYDGVDLLDITKLYENNLILSIIQISNFILVLWIMITGFYYLYKYFKNKYD